LFMISAIAHPILLLLALGRITVKERTDNSSFSSHMQVLTTTNFRLYHTHAVRAWNKLPESVVTLPMNSFKHRILCSDL